MKKRILICLLVLAMLLTGFAGCGKSGKNPDLDTSKEIVIRVVGPWEDFSALEIVAQKFTEKYDNVVIEYEYVQDYYASLEKRLPSGENTIDLFLTTNIQEGNALLPYTLDLYSDERVDLSQTFEGLVHNFEYMGSGDTKQIYAVPMGAEVRGMYVNVTLLKSLGLEIPTNRTEFMAACETLKQNGYMPLGGNPGLFAQQLMYPYVSNIIANSDDYETVYNKVNTREAGISELFREPMQLMYDIVSNGYYDYKKVETETNCFTDTSDTGVSRDFLNIVSDDGGETYTKADDTGLFAFVPQVMSMETTLAKVKDDYHSEIEYKFILSPVGEEGGYAYLSPAHGIAINKNSANLDWTIEFFNYLFTPEINKVLAENQPFIPNTKEAAVVIAESFNVPESHISDLGQVTFDYAFYETVKDSLMAVAKANNPKYMKDNGDGTASMYDFEYYMQNLETALTAATEE